MGQLFDFRDLVTGMQVEDPDQGTVPILELQEQHKVRFVMRTTKGLIVLRYMPLRTSRIIRQAMGHMYPQRLQLEAEARTLLPYFEGVDEKDVDPDARKRFEDIALQLQITDMSALGVIVQPMLADMDDYERLYESLTPDEQVQLASAVRDLSTPVDPSRVDATALEIAQANGLQIMDEEMLHLMTVSQASFWTDRIVKESRKAEELARRMRGDSRR